MTCYIKVQNQLEKKHVGKNTVKNKSFHMNYYTYNSIFYTIIQRYSYLIIIFFILTTDIQKYS